MKMKIVASQLTVMALSSRERGAASILLRRLGAASIRAFLSDAGGER